MRITSLQVSIAVIAAAVLAFAIYYFAVVLPRGELGQKQPFATLQGVELAHRHDADVEKPLVVDNALGTSYTVLGVPVRDPQSPRAWLILNDSAADGSVFLLPGNASPRLSCSYVSQLANTTSIDEVVLKFLRGACSDAP